MNINASGRRWARGFLVLALIVSVVGNVAHTVLADSEISLWLRVPGAVVWPMFTFGAVEILVRVIWEKRAPHVFARLFLLAVSIPAAITSYEHLFQLLKMSGESMWIAVIGPAAIDGMMIGCTMVLLFTRNVPTVETTPVNLDAAEERLERLVAEQTFADEVRLAQEMSIEEVSPLPELSAAPLAPPIPRVASKRATRSQWDARRVAELAVDGAKARIISETLKVPPATAARFAKVARILKADPRATIDPSEKVHPDHVAIMRELVSR
jgi:hypothetical protein